MHPRPVDIDRHCVGGVVQGANVVVPVLVVVVGPADPTDVPIPRLHEAHGDPVTPTDIGMPETKLLHTRVPEITSVPPAAIMRMRDQSGVSGVMRHSSTTTFRG